MLSWKSRHKKWKGSDLINALFIDRGVPVSNIIAMSHATRVVLQYCNTTSATIGAGTADPSGSPEYFVGFVLNH